MSSCNTHNNRCCPASPRESCTGRLSPNLPDRYLDPGPIRNPPTWLNPISCDIAEFVDGVGRIGSIRDPLGPHKRVQTQGSVGTCVTPDSSSVAETRKSELVSRGRNPENILPGNRCLPMTKRVPKFYPKKLSRPKLEIACLR